MRTRFETFALTLHPEKTRLNTLVVKVIPPALTILDPIWTHAYVTRNHGFMVFDTLYAIAFQFRAQLQMLDGHTTEIDAEQYKLTLRDGVKWHDGEQVPRAMPRAACCLNSPTK